MIPIPTTVIVKVNDYITTNYPTLTTKQKSKFYTKLIELWFFIKEHHLSDVSILEDNEERLKDSGLSHHKFTNIHHTQIEIFYIRIGKTILTYKNLIDILISIELIEKNDKYSTGRFSQSYRPHISLNYETLKTVEISLDKVFKNTKSQQDLLNENAHTYRKLIDDLYLVSIDLENFYWHLDQSIGLPYSNRSTAVLTANKAYSLKIQALKINLGIHFFTVSSTGRIYSSIANLPTIMLPFLKLNNREVIEIDATNSQPLLLSSLVNHPHFRSDVENGVFYERMAQSLDITRQEFKLKSYRWIFFNDEQIGSTWKNKLDNVYPGLADMINQLKAQQPLWFLLQKAESAIWIKVAQLQLFPILTRHDSMLVYPERLEAVKKQIIKEYRKQGLKVTLK